MALHLRQGMSSAPLAQIDQSNVCNLLNIIPLLAKSRAGGNGHTYGTHRLHLPIIRRPEDAPVFWDMTLEQLKAWYEGVVIEDVVVEEYYQAALSDAIADVAQAMSPMPNPNPHGASQDEEADMKGKRFGFKSVGCDRRDLMFMTVLAESSPFSPPGQKGRIFMECAKILRVRS